MQRNVVLYNDQVAICFCWPFSMLRQEALTAYLVGMRRVPKSMTAAMPLDRSRMRPSSVLVDPLASLWSPELEEPDRLRYWRESTGCASCLIGLLISGSMLCCLYCWACLPGCP